LPAQIKLGTIISDDFFKGLRTFSARLATPPKACSLVYGGTERQIRSNASIWRVGDVADMMGMME
jgi:hypothetical protein